MLSNSSITWNLSSPASPSIGTAGLRWTCPHAIPTRWVRTHFIKSDSARNSAVRKANGPATVTLRASTVPSNSRAIWRAEQPRGLRAANEILADYKAGISP